MIFRRAFQSFSSKTCTLLRRNASTFYYYQRFEQIGFDDDCGHSVRLGLTLCDDGTFKYQMRTQSTDDCLIMTDYTQVVAHGIVGSDEQVEGGPARQMSMFLKDTATVTRGHLTDIAGKDIEPDSKLANKAIQKIPIKHEIPFTVNLNEDKSIARMTLPIIQHMPGEEIYTLKLLKCLSKIRSERGLFAMGSPLDVGFVPNTDTPT